MTFLASQKIVDAYDKAFWFVTGTSIVLMVGIMAAMVAGHCGARNIIITDINDYRLNLAKEVAPKAIPIDSMFSSHLDFWESAMKITPSAPRKTSLRVEL